MLETRLQELEARPNGRDPADPTELAQLRAELQALRLEVQKQSLEVKRVLHPLYVAGAAVLVLGIGSVLGTRKWAMAKVKQMIQDAMYGLDPTYVKVKVPARNFEKGRAFLTRLGFRNISTYPSLSAADCTEGCVIYRIDSQEDAELLGRFLDAEKPAPSSVAYVLFAPRRVEHNLGDQFENLTFSNTLATLGTQVFAVTRNLLSTRAAGRKAPQ